MRQLPVRPFFSSPPTGVPHAVIRPFVLAIALSPLFFSGCISTSFHPARTFEARDLPPVTSGAVCIFRSEPNGAFLTLGEIVAPISAAFSRTFPPLRVTSDAIQKRAGSACSCSGQGRSRAGHIGAGSEQKETP